MSFHERLVELNKRGLIHAPDEPVESFVRRCRMARTAETVSTPSLAKKMFDIDPDWIGIVYDNKGLRFWEGACTWKRQDSITLQLKKVFQKKNTHFGYARDEVIAHELVHVVRGNFEEPIFEEILAYQSSPSPFRRLFAPIFRTPKESMFFILSLAALFTATLFNAFEIAFAGFCCIVAGGALRLYVTQRTFKKTRKKLCRLVGEEHVLAMMLRLTDREIIRFSRMTLEEVKGYAKKMTKIHLRWQQITSSYFPKE